MLIGTHTGTTAYSGTIESSFARLFIVGTWNAADTEITAAKLSLSKSGRENKTMIPDMTLGALMDLAGGLEGMVYYDAANKQISFSLPLSFGGALDLSMESIMYSLSNCTAGATYEVYAIDDAVLQNDFFDVTPVSMTGSGSKEFTQPNIAYVLADLSKIGKITLQYPGRRVEYPAAELKEIARLNNNVHKVTALGVLTPGYGTYALINVRGAGYMKIDQTTTDVVYLVNHYL